jgi:hypothetical protein
MRADGASRYPGHIKPLEQVVHAIQAIRHVELLGEEPPNIFATNPSTATAVLWLFNCLAIGSLLRFRKPLRAPIVLDAR